MKKLFATGVGWAKSKSVLWVEGTITFGASCSRNILPLPELISLSHGEYYLSFLVTLKIFSFQTQPECLEIDTLGLHSSLGSSDPLEEAQEGKIRRNDSFHFHGTCTPQECALKLHLVKKISRWFWIFGISLMWSVGGTMRRLLSLHMF